MNDEPTRSEAAEPIDAAAAWLVMTTVDSAAAADALAASLVEARLAACVQIVPVHSVYRWDGEVKRDAEWLLLIKTAAPFVEVAQAVRIGHPYDLPELVPLSIDAGSPDYLQWLRDEARR